MSQSREKSYRWTKENSGRFCKGEVVHSCEGEYNRETPFKEILADIGLLADKSGEAKKKEEETRVLEENLKKSPRAWTMKRKSWHPILPMRT